ncbi:IPT/TIG domain-containing protein [Corallococcus terminator]|uniref:IPT/TIG domain-containing protein n=1 Tax=Corallococcus terminator TaxID=2316733 RepID=UPI0013154182|nr:IPT/TIG domain-containing protein [Corallococcus terminator]
MRLPVAAALLSLVACSETTEGPTPKLEGLINPLERLVTPARVCNAGGGARGWPLEIVGTGFNPLPRDALTDTPTVELPRVTLSGPSDYTLPADHLFFARAELMRMDLPTRDSTPSSQLAPGTYTVAVTNPLGGTATLEDGLRVVPAPTLQSITAPQGFFYGGGSPLVIEGSGFRSDALPLITLHRAGEEDTTLFTLTVVSDTRIEAEVPPTTPEGTYDLVLTNPEGCSVTRPQALTVTYPKLGLLTLSPRSGPASNDTSITLDNNARSGDERPFSYGIQDVYLVAPVKADPSQRVNIPLREVTFVSGSQLTATVPTCAGFDPLPVTSPQCPGGIVPGGPYALIIADPSGAVGVVPESAGFTVSASLLNDAPTP